MSKILNDGLTRSGTWYFTAVPIWRQWASELIKGVQLKLNLNEYEVSSLMTYIRTSDCRLLCSVPQILALMVDLEDEPDWSVADEIEEDDNDRFIYCCHSV